MDQPSSTEWIRCAIERRAHDLAILTPCTSVHCMLLPDNNGDRHAADCHCYDRKHAMIQMAKINSRFVCDVANALKGSD